MLRQADRKIALLRRVTRCFNDYRQPERIAHRLEEMAQRIYGLADIDHFAQFIRGTKVPPRDAVLAATPDTQAGQAIFETIGCSTCHVGTIVTAPAGTAINGGTFTVPQALGNKIIHPYGDFLLHDIGTGDGIVQTPQQDTAHKLRTAPLWGLRMRPRFMHDLKSLSLADAIERHRGEAERWSIASTS